MLEEEFDALSQMMAEHMAMPFPPGLRGVDIEDQDLVMLGTDAYGYAGGVLRGPLSEQRRGGLLRLMAVFEKVLPALNDPYATRYYAHARDMAALSADIESLREQAAR